MKRKQKKNRFWYINIISLFIIIILFFTFRNPLYFYLLQFDDSSTTEYFRYNGSVESCEWMEKEYENEISKDYSRYGSFFRTTQESILNLSLLTTCNSDFDCILVPKSCVGTSVGGEPFSINGKYRDSYFKISLPKCKTQVTQRDPIYGTEYTFPADYMVESRNMFFSNNRAYCMNNTCRVKRIPSPEEINKCYTDAAITENNVSCCNKTDDRATCIYETAKTNNEPSYCKYILDDYDDCYIDIVCKNRINCESKLKEQIRKDFPDISTKEGKYGFCFSYKYVEITDLVGNNVLLDPHEINGNYNNKKCCFFNSEIPLFFLKAIDTKKPLALYYFIDLVYFNSSYYDLSWHSQDIYHINGFTYFYIKNNTWNKPIDYYLSSDECNFSDKSYDLPLELTSNYCENRDYIEKNDFKNDFCYELMRSNEMIRCFDEYSIKNKNISTCRTVGCNNTIAIQLKNITLCGSSDSCKASIIKNKAIKEKNISLCDYFDFIDYLNCANDVASVTQNPRDCDKVIIIRRHECYQKISSLKPSDVIIDSLYDDLNDCYDNRDKTSMSTGVILCRIAEAALLNNSEICDRLYWKHKESGLKCYEAVMSLFGSFEEGLEMCKKMDFPRGKCYKDVAIKYNKSEICEIADAYREECYEYFI